MDFLNNSFRRSNGPASDFDRGFMQSDGFGMSQMSAGGFGMMDQQRSRRQTGKYNLAAEFMYPKVPLKSPLQQINKLYAQNMSRKCDLRPAQRGDKSASAANSKSIVEWNGVTSQRDSNHTRATYLMKKKSQARFPLKSKYLTMLIFSYVDTHSRAMDILKRLCSASYDLYHNHMRTLHYDDELYKMFGTQLKTGIIGASIKQFTEEEDFKVEINKAL